MRCTIVRSQSRSLSLPQRGSCSCAARKEAKAGLYCGAPEFGVAIRFKFEDAVGEVRAAREEMMVGKEVMKGV